ncbi:MAG TPA: tetratricopeptide repeat protein [Pyrinomonadaceae bacterium]|nr:tetratricopeptide repeat protein [Pyrinomonadaceae bacterium]
MFIRVVCAILLSAAGFIAVPISTAAQGRSAIIGYVFGPDRKPVARVRVELRDAASITSRRAETDNSGRFVFNNLGVGRFEIRATLPGSDFDEQIQQVEVGGGAGGGYETAQVEVQLRPRRPDKGTAAGAVVFSQEVPDEARRLYQAALADFDAQRTPAAIQQLEKAVAIFPTYFAALERLGVEYMKAKKYSEARKTFAAAVETNSRSFNGWYGLSYANFATENFAESIDAAGKAAEIDKNAAEVYFVTGLSQRRLKKYHDAEKSFVRAKQLDKGRTPDIHWNLALLYAHNLNQYGKAADELELFLKATPDNPEAANIRKLIANFRSK